MDTIKYQVKHSVNSNNEIILHAFKGYELHANMIDNHTCQKLQTEICEIRQMFKGDLIKFCEIFTKITLELPQSSQKPLFKC